MHPKTLGQHLSAMRIGETIYSKDHDGFTSSDSVSGNWSATQKDMTEDVQQTQFAFVGNFK
jgi:hypothetical protein